MNIKIKAVHPDAKMPTYATGGAGMFDLYAANLGNSIAEVPATNKAVVPQGSLSIGTGLAFEIPRGMVMLVFSRSGMGFKHGIRLANCVGVIDSDYRGEVLVKLHRDENNSMCPAIRVGDRIAQALIVPALQVGFEWASHLSDTGRGQGGLGSTGQ